MDVVKFGSFFGAIISNGKLFTFLTKPYEEIGLNREIINSCLGHENHTVNDPTLVDFFCDKNVTQVACGDFYLLVVANNELYSYGCIGDARKYALGFDDGFFSEDVIACTPTLVPFFHRKSIRKIASGSNLSAVVTREGLYLFGICTTYHAQTDEYIRIYLKQPTKIDFFNYKSIDKLIVNDTHVVVTVGSTVYKVGDYCQDNQISRVVSDYNIHIHARFLVPQPFSIGQVNVNFVSLSGPYMMIGFNSPPDTDPEIAVFMMHKNRYHTFFRHKFIGSQVSRAMLGTVFRDSNYYFYGLVVVDGALYGFNQSIPHILSSQLMESEEMARISNDSLFRVQCCNFEIRSMHTCGSLAAVISRAGNIVILEKNPDRSETFKISDLTGINLGRLREHLPGGQNTEKNDGRALVLTFLSLFASIPNNTNSALIGEELDSVVLPQMGLDCQSPSI